MEDFINFPRFTTKNETNSRSPKHSIVNSFGKIYSASIIVVISPTRIKISLFTTFLKGLGIKLVI